MEGPPPPNPHLDAQLLRDKEASVRFELAQSAKAARLESVAQWDGDKAWGVYGEWVERTNPLNVRNPYHPERPAPLEVPDVLGDGDALFSTSWYYANLNGRAYLERSNHDPHIPGYLRRLHQLDPRNTYPLSSASGPFPDDWNHVRPQEPHASSLWDTVFRSFRDTDEFSRAYRTP